MSKAAKQYAPAYWIKQALRYESKPEDRIIDCVRAYRRDPASCPVAFTGTPQALLDELYIELRRYLKSVHFALFPTPMQVARDLAAWLGIRPGHVVFDPCAGTGNLLAAAAESGARVHGMEIQSWLPDLLTALDLNVTRGDFLDYPHAIPAYDFVLVNPPFGRIGNSTDATTEFMARLADLAPSGTRIGAILPHGHFSRPLKARMEVAGRFTWGECRHLPAGTFKPLTNVETSMHLLTVR